MFAFIKIINVLLQQPVDTALVAKMYSEVNPFDHASEIRILYMFICCLPFAFMLLFKNKIWQWLSAGLISILTIINSMDAIEHFIQGDTVFSIVFLLLVGGFGVLSVLFTVKWAKEETSTI